MARIIMCGSFKGGVGKTASFWNRAYSLAEMGKRVLAVDFDSQANLTICFGVEDPVACDSYCFQQAVNRKYRAIGIVSERLRAAICQCEDLYVWSYRTNGLCCRIYVLFSGFAVF